MHDYLDYQPSRKQVELLKKVRLHAARKGGENSAKARNQVGSTKTQPTRPTPYRTVPNRTVPTPKNKKLSAAASDDDWLSGLESNPAYAGIDVRREFGKAGVWHRERGREVTRRSFVNWLNRAERPIRAVGSVPPATLGRQLEASLPAIQRFMDRGEA